MSILDGNKTFEDVIPEAVKICSSILVEEANLNGPYVCPGFVSSYGPAVSSAII